MKNGLWPEMKPPPLILKGTPVELDKKSLTNNKNLPATPPNMPGGTTGPKTRRRESIAIRAREFLSAVVKGNMMEVSRKISPQALKIAHPVTGSVALHLAVLNGHMKIVEIILSYSVATIDAKDNEGRTPLHYAAALLGLHGDPAMYYYLMEKGAKDTILDAEGFTAQDVRQNPSLVSLDRVRYQNVYPLAVDAEWDSLFASHSEDELAKMVRNGVLDLAHAPPLPLHLEVFSRLTQLQAQVLGVWEAVSAEDDRTLKQLVCDKSMALCRDSDGRTPLHNAYRRGHQPSIEYLLHLAPEAAKIRDKKGRLPVDYSYSAPLLAAHVPNLANRRPSRTKILHHERFHVVSKTNEETPRGAIALTSIEASSPEGIEPSVLERIQGININERDFSVLEEIQMEGKADQIWRVVKKNIGNSELARHVNEFRQIQMRLNSAIDAIEKNDDVRLRQLADDDVMNTRDTRGKSNPAIFALTS
ncbi:unnamed protein product [Caenorhabditis auriculariae]|uniref:Uncharacterized protein n=1 Tax=Caenorhabditis auriculariae TaxID=2777116 RepID=A0A8S1GXK8_9PELO|nr:unnamed protein product [Caenorhabditis auriculariae]